MTKGNASTNTQSAMGAIRFIIFERLATTKCIVLAARTCSPHPTRNAIHCYCNEDLVLCHNISCESFESLSSRLHNRYRHMACLAFFDISHGAGFARMRASDDFAFRAVLQFSFDMGFHQEPPESPALYSESSAAKLARSCPAGSGYQGSRRVRNRRGGLVLWQAALGGVGGGHFLTTL